ncbi:MAG: helix-turn-helix domain-containing protein [Propionibacteriaceae bacterium]|jgi:transcriptional regulator with XRE-family HTH domain|nr:helix-turn-helix domain-containing protein [Propionibacteriaceae bacterium]
MVTHQVTDWIQLAELVREQREKQHLSQAALARAAKVSRYWLIGFEAGEKRSAPFDMIMRLLLELNLSITLTPIRITPIVEDGISASEVIRRHTQGA